jgi:ABC-type oligopeptide transport system substrate-binding subunit
MNVTLHRRSLRLLAALLTLTALTAACGKSDESAEKGAATTHSKKHPGTEPEVTDPDVTDPGEGLANAVIVGKTAPR